MPSLELWTWPVLRCEWNFPIVDEAVHICWVYGWANAREGPKCLRTNLTIVFHFQLLMLKRMLRRIKYVSFPSHLLPCSGPVVCLQDFHPKTVKFCSMHTINLGLCFVINGGALLLSMFSSFCAWLCFGDIMAWFIVYCTMYYYSTSASSEDFIDGPRVLRCEPLCAAAARCSLQAVQTVLHHPEDQMFATPVHWKDGHLDQVSPFLLEPFMTNKMYNRTIGVVATCTRH